MPSSSGFGSITDLAHNTTTKPKTVLSEKIVDIAEKEREQEAREKARLLGIPHIDLSAFPVSQFALKQLPLQRAKALEAICFYATAEAVRIGALDPARPDVQELVKEFREKNIEAALYLISKKSIDRIFALYATLPEVVAITKDVAINPKDLLRVQADVHDFSSLKPLLERATTTDIISVLLGSALKLDASDIHVEPEKDQIVVRFRLDGVLYEAATLPKDMFQRLISRVKLVSSLKINVTDTPQDGRFTIQSPSGEVDVRVSTMPTVYGESVVLRLLPQKKEGIDLLNLGFAPYAFSVLERESRRPNGMIITTGPTGSGKTTTLYAVMQGINKPGVKIITLEDPVEYKMQGINQSQVDQEKGYTFAKGLKSLLRQDPDICMVGEIRDLETADIAIQAALTGHLILSTIHTNSAAGAIPRFLSMGVKPFLLAPALNAIVGQRLVRRLRDEVRVPITLSSEQTERVEKILEALPEPMQKEVLGKERQWYGIKEGILEMDAYHGRIGIYEIFSMTPEIEQMILSGSVSEYEIEQAAVKGGMVTMVQDALLKAMQGLTTIEEVFRVTE